jgi:hypothetical protein
MNSGKKSTLVMEIFKVKIQSDGMLDKLKTQMVVRGNLQDKNISEDKWSPMNGSNQLRKSLKLYLMPKRSLKTQ